MAGEPLPMSLRVEGRAMLGAIVEDLADVPGVSVVASLDARLVDQRPLMAQVVLVEPGEATAIFEREAKRADVTLLIAPELDGLLLSLTQQLERMGVTTLGSKSDAIALTADKLESSRQLTQAGVPVLLTAQLDDAPIPYDFPLVIKPRCGVGSTNILVLGDAQAYETTIERLRADGLLHDTIVQPLHPGLAVSASFIIGSRQTIELRPATQRLSDDGRFRYHGGDVPIPPGLAKRATTLGRRAVDAIEGLRGHVGVDLILGDAEDGSEDVVAEINPRMTTSYVGLRAMSPDNLSEAWLKLCAGEEADPPMWYDHSVRFTCDGRVRLS